MRVGTDYLGLYLVHWPVPLNSTNPKNGPLIPLLPDGTRDVDRSWDLRRTWAQMDSLLTKEKVRSIVVSNFSEANLKKILPVDVLRARFPAEPFPDDLVQMTVLPAVNQLELYVYNRQHKLLAFLASFGIRAEAYSPLGSGDKP